MLERQEAELSSLERRHDSFMKKLTAQYAANMARLGASQKKLKKLAISRRAQLTSLNSRHRFWMDKLKSGHSAELDRLNAIISTLTESAGLQQERLEADNERIVAELMADAKGKAVQQVQRYTTMMQRLSIADSQAVIWRSVSSCLSSRLDSLEDGAGANADTQVTTSEQLMLQILIF